MTQEPSAAQATRSVACPACQWPVTVREGTIAQHRRFDTSTVCTASGTVPPVTFVTPAGRAIDAEMRRLLAEAVAAADEDEQNSFTRTARQAERDQLRRLLRWFPDEVARAEREAAEMATVEDARMDAVLETVAA